MKKVLITGIGGQDGSYLAELLLARGDLVHGIERPAALAGGLPLLAKVEKQIHLHAGTLTDGEWLAGVVRALVPDECYHLAASSFVSYDSAAERDILQNNIESTHGLLAALKQDAPACRLVFAGSSEMFGLATEAPQHEQTCFKPRSVYGISKVAGFHLVDYYRRQHGQFACTAIFYNHESPRRAESYVTRKITRSLARIVLGRQDKLVLGNLEARRDWGYAPDYMRMLPRMLGRDAPVDYVVATGQLHSVRDFVEAAAAALGVSLEWEGRGLDARATVKEIDPSCLAALLPGTAPSVRIGDSIIAVDPDYFRPDEAVPLVGDSSAAHRLGWQPETTFHEMVAEMVWHDLRELIAGEEARA